MSCTKLFCCICTQRDPKRISKIIKKLEKLWLKYPDMRFGQLLFNFIYTDGKVKFHQEDDEIDKMLE